jgi:FkbM family methyltransferase
MILKRLIKKVVPPLLVELGWKILTFITLKYYSFVFKPLIIRKHTSDIHVFRSIFVKKELEVPIEINPKLIIDAGAYTGLSALYYSSKYPQAKIIAVEPESSNFELLEKHTKYIPNVVRVKSGLWYRNAFLRIINKDKDKWAFVVKEVVENEPYDTPAITILSLLKQSGLDSEQIDILKLDIEGSEKELFSKNSDKWLGKVKVIVIELHDRITKGCTEALFSAIRDSAWDEHRKGEKVILVRKWDKGD